MTAQRIALGLVILAFGDLTAYAVYQHGYLAFFDLHQANAINLQIFADLVISLGLASIWMVSDARSRGISPVPYLLVTLFLGSFGPLFYLLRRTWGVRPAARALSPAARTA
jgi:hypothetical protein